jgi:vitamin B12 transporter
MKNKLKLSLVASCLLASSVYGVDGQIEIVKSATKTYQKVTEVTSSIEVINQAELSRKHYTTVAQALQSISGIDITSNGGLGQGSFVRINGMHYSSVLVLIDGIRYNDITNGSAFLENLLIDDVKQIEVLKGAQSGVWGADASGGVINIITKKQIFNGINSSINVEVGSFNTKKYGFTTSFKKDKIYGKINRQKITSDGFTAQAPKGKDIDNYEDDKYENTTTNLKFGYKIDDKNKLDLSHTIIDSQADYDDGAWGSSIEQQANDSTYHSTSKSKFSSINFNNINSFNELDIYAKKSIFNRNANGTLYKGEVKELGLKSKINYKQNNFIVLGADEKDFIQTKDYDYKYNNKGLFVTNNNQVEKVVLTQSIRYDKYDKFKNKLTGKIGIKYPYKDMVLGSNYGTGYKAPSLYELSHDGGNKLKPEYTKSFDITTQYKKFKARYFYNKIDDLLVYVTDHYENGSGVSKIKGYELSYKNNILKDTSLLLSYTYTNAKDKDDKILGRVPKELLKAKFNYSGIAKLNLGLDATYVGYRWDGVSNKDTRPNETGKYTVFNTVAHYDIDHKTKIYFKINNLTNKYYQTVENYATSPRAYYVGMKYNF